MKIKFTVDKEAIEFAQGEVNGLGAAAERAREAFQKLRTALFTPLDPDRKVARGDVVTLDELADTVIDVTATSSDDAATDGGAG